MAAIRSFTKLAVQSRVAIRQFSDKPAMTLNFVTPHSAIYTSKVVSSVKVPGVSGEYGVTAGHTPVIAELKAGLFTINHESGEDETYFVSGGFALTHDNSTTDVSVLEAVKLDSLDEALVRDTYSKSKSEFDNAEAGSVAKAEAQISMETSKAMASALGMTV